MKLHVSLTVVGALIAGFVPVNSRAQKLPIPEEWDTYYAWFLVVNPEHLSASPDEEKALTSAHIQYQLRLQEADQAIVAGGLAEAQEIAGAVPAVLAGRLVPRVREWWVPAGRLP